MKTFAVLGDQRVENSLSPRMHNAVLGRLGLDGVYVSLAVRRRDLANAIKGLAALNFAGANVTVPHKEAAARLVDRLEGAAGKLAALNTIVFQEGQTVGHNTDVGGFARALAQAGFDPAGASALLIGAGGAARAVALALSEGGAERVVVAARNRERAQAVAGLVGGREAELANLAYLAAEADIIVNASAASSPAEAGQTANLAAAAGERCHASLVVDINYGRQENIWQDLAGASDARFLDGLAMLAGQAALSFELWTGHQPDPQWFLNALG